jgi:AcrR family transcriptional regulator
MSTSAISVNRRERKMQETAARLTSISRRFTGERGLSGFTIEELCAEADVSRRTFFNYFATKEDAVIGAHPEEDFRQLSEEFLARGSHGWQQVIDDLVDLIIIHFEAAGIDAVEHAEFHAAIEREPRLFLRFMGISRELDRRTVEMVCVREGVAYGDLHADAAVNALTSLLRSAGEVFLQPDNTDDFASILRSRLAALRAVLAPLSRKGTQ